MLLQCVSNSLDTEGGREDGWGFILASHQNTHAHSQSTSKYNTILHEGAKIENKAAFEGLIPLHAGSTVTTPLNITGAPM